MDLKPVYVDDTDRKTLAKITRSEARAVIRRIVNSEARMPKLDVAAFNSSI